MLRSKQKDLRSVRLFEVCCTIDHFCGSLSLIPCRSSHTTQWNFGFHRPATR